MDYRRMFASFKQSETELLEYIREQRIRVMPRVASKASFCPAPVSQQSSALTCTSGGQSYLAQTLSSFAKSSRPLRGHSDPLPERPRSHAEDKFVARYTRDVASESDFHEEPTVYKKLTQLSTELNGMVDHIPNQHLRSKVCRFVDEVEGYVSEERLKVGSSEILSSSAMQREIQKLVEDAVRNHACNQEDLSRKVASLEEQLKRKEKIEAELKSCVEKLRVENTRLQQSFAKEKSSTNSRLEVENTAFREENKRLREEVKTLTDARNKLKHSLDERDLELKDFKSSTKKMAHEWIQFLELTGASKSQSVLSVTKTDVGSVNGSNRVRIQATKQNNNPEDRRRYPVDVNKNKTRSEKAVLAIPSASSVGLTSVRYDSVGGIDGDADSDSESESLTDTDSGLHTEFQTNMQQMQDKMNMLRKSLESRL